MQPRKRHREYRGSSCLRCHKQKVKCSRENPCRGCAAAKKACVYVVRDKSVTIAESYLKQLQAAAANTKTPGHDRDTCQDAVSTPVTGRQHIRGSESTSPPALRPLFANPNPLVENSTAARFVSKLKEIQNPKTVDAEFGSWPQNNVASQPNVYEYFTLNSDTSHAKCTFKLPPYPYAIFLVNQFLIYLAHDWHWFRLGRFQQRLVNVYTIPDSAESKDRIWLCQLLVAFALGSSIIGQDPKSKFPRPLSSADSPGQSYSQPSPQHKIPGVEFFEQALGLLKIPYEEVSVEHIETLNMVALCSYCLNRQKTTYMYSGISSRMCNMLQLHQASSSRDLPPVERENRKRVWWSTFCIDRMASTQMGILPTLQIEQGDLGYPTNDGLAPEDMDEFSDPDYLTARIHLTIIQADAVKNNDNNDNDIDNSIQPTLQKLLSWKGALPVHMSAPFHESMAEKDDNRALLRSLANLHLRYNHCLILLLRPLLLRQISAIVSGEENGVLEDETKLQDLNQICLNAARSSLHMLIDLRTCSLLARLGFMENMHLFCSLIVICLARVISSQRPNSLNVDTDDDVAYDSGKDVLQDMAHAGSLAARGHVTMLADVEAMAQSITLGDSIAGADVLTEHWDADDWMTQLFESDNLADLF